MVQSGPVTGCLEWHPLSSCSLLLGCSSAATDWGREAIRIGGSPGSSGIVAVALHTDTALQHSQSNFYIQKRKIELISFVFFSVLIINRVPFPEFPAASFVWRTAETQHPPHVVTYSAGSVLQSGATPRSAVVKTYIEIFSHLGFISNMWKSEECLDWLSVKVLSHPRHL